MTYNRVTTTPSASSYTLPCSGIGLSPNRRPHHTVPSSHIVRSGLVSMKDDSFGNWLFRRKWLVLREETLTIHKNESAPQHSVIMLNDISKIERIDLKPQCLLLETTYRRFYLSLKNDEELYGWLDDIYSLSPLMGASGSPTNFVHKVHVRFDPVSGQFTGMPEQWNTLLTKSAMTREDHIEDSGPNAGRHFPAAFSSGSDNHNSPTAAAHAAALVNGSHVEGTLSTMTVYVIFEGQEMTVLSSTLAS